MELATSGLIHHASPNLLLTLFEGPSGRYTVQTWREEFVNLDAENAMFIMEYMAEQYLNYQANAHRRANPPKGEGQ